MHQDNDPGRVGELAGEWSRLGTEMGEAAQRMAERLRGTEHGWQGEAATAARGAIHEIAGWTSAAGSTAGDLGKHVEEQGRAMEEAKSSMPEPVDVEFDDEIVDRWAAGGTGLNALQGMLMAYSDLSEQAVEADSKHDEAVQVMQRMEHLSRVLDGDTPRFEPPPDPIRTEQEQGELRPTAKLTPHHQATPANVVAAEAQQPAEPVAPGGDQATRKMPVLGDPAAGTPASSEPASSEPASSEPANALAPERPQAPQQPDRGGPIPKLGDTQLPAGTTPTSRSGPSGRTPAAKSNFDPPTVKHVKPSGTTPQSAKPRSVPNPSSPNITGRGTYQPRPVSGPDAPTAITPNPFAKNPGGGPGSGGPGGSRGGWSGSIPSVPGTSGGSGGAVGAGGAGSGGAASGGSGPGAGGRAGVGPTGGTAGGQPAGAAGAAGATGQAGAGGMAGGAPGQANRGKGGEDQERRAKYVESTPIVEAQGVNLPPPVIGGGKPKKKDKD
ncbi:WXG100 family type VII secretion target [Saccharopolyspora gregorii]|uniref:PPE domain-containing protein n=1 Tax=Saccharopolyspora gregorii TaxID=33914 RepID=A0ABP6RX45_9PSEU